MQAFLLLEEKTSEKLQEANEDLSKAEKQFAAKYNVNLVNSKNELTEKKMGLAGKVNSYTDKIYIIFFKCNWEDGQLFNALNAHKLNDAEQAKKFSHGVCERRASGITGRQPENISGQPFIGSRLPGSTPIL